MWWEKSYINRRDWMLENQGTLKLTPNQLVILMMIDFMKTQNLVISLESLAERCALSVAIVDEIVQSLVSAHVLDIRLENQEVVFNMDSLFKDGLLYEFVDENLFQVFETEFGRLLSQNELQTINTWLQRYSDQEILEALRSAMVYQKLSMNYINSILVNNRKEKQV